MIRVISRDLVEVDGAQVFAVDAVLSGTFRPRTRVIRVGGVGAGKSGTVRATVGNKVYVDWEDGSTTESWPEELKKA